MTETRTQTNLLDLLPQEEWKPELPDPEDIRDRLHALLIAVEQAERMPWTPPRAETKANIFHQMANWLPEDEREELRTAFRARFEWLRDRE